MTAAEHRQAVVDLGCIVCRLNGYATPATLHHLRHGVGMGQRQDDSHTLPLCPYHHQQGPRGEAIHAGQKSFERKYGSEMDLLRMVYRLLGKEIPGKD